MGGGDYGRLGEGMGGCGGREGEGRRGEGDYVRLGEGVGGGRLW